MIRKIAILALSLGLFAYSFLSCRHEPFDQEKGNFPAEVSRILIYKCANEGCHDAAGAVNAAKLRLDSWEELFKGSSHGAVVVPYSTKYSTLLYYVNQESHSNNDIVAIPSMPYNATALTEEEYNTLKSWIANGAPDAAGNIPFADNPDTRQKIYMTQQQCEDLVTVIDAKSGQVMRYIPIGIEPGRTEVAHNVKFSPDGQYAYVCFVEGTVIQKLDVKTDKVVGSVAIGSGGWNVIYLSPDGKKLLVSDLNNNLMVKVNAESMTIDEVYDAGFKYAHGIAASPSFDTMYITSQNTNIVYRFIPNDLVEPIFPIYLEGDEEIMGYREGNTNPHEIVMSADNKKLFVTCENTHEVRVIDIATNEITTISVGIRPKEMTVWKKKNWLFVTCIDDINTSTAKARGSVYVIDMNTLQKVGSPIYGDFYMPHGITVDEQHDRLYIASENLGIDGPAPHHSSGCDGRNGWYNIYDLNTLRPVNNIRYEVTPDPYGLDTRFK